MEVADFISRRGGTRTPEDVFTYISTLVFDGIGTLAAATHPKVTSSAGIGAFAAEHGGIGQATLVGQSKKVDVVNAVLANGTRGYAVDMEPHHPEAILHPIAVMLPTALALSEAYGRSGRDMLEAVAVGCEISYRVSMAMRPKALYALGFHPSAVCGGFGAAATASVLLDLDQEQTVRALGLAGLQASGLMAWEDDPREDARPFQMGMAARNGVTAALLAKRGFGAPDRIFDGGHNVLQAFSRSASSEPLVDGLGERWDGVLELAIKPYPCVAFLHPALDALAELIDEHCLRAQDVSSIELRFAQAGCHCIDNNPLKSHCAQYVLPVRLVYGRLEFTNIFEDIREIDEDVARLSAQTFVIPDNGEFDGLFPDFYVGEISLNLENGKSLKKRSDIARGYPEAPLSEVEIRTKFDELVSAVAGPERRRQLRKLALGIAVAESVRPLAEALSLPARPAATVVPTSLGDAN
ncbi:MAG: MmgE/PrpD family protein, partial [Hyphomicrobiaceae bacterium]